MREVGRTLEKSGGSKLVHSLKKAEAIQKINSKALNDVGTA